MGARSIRRFEDAFAEFQGAAAARAFWSGRTALYAVLRALGVKAGDAVGLGAYCPAGTVQAILTLGAQPVFLDVTRHLTVSPRALQRVRGPLRSLVLQHTFGVPADVAACVAWAERTGTPIIEDCSHGPGSVWEDRRIGSFGRAAVFSFGWGMPLSLGAGGMAMVNDAALADALDELAVQALKAPAGRRFGLSIHRRIYPLVSRGARHVRPVQRWAERRGMVAGCEPAPEPLRALEEGFLRRLPGGLGRAGRRALRSYTAIADRRIESEMWLRRRLEDEGIRVERAPPATQPVYWRVPVWVEGKRRVLACAQREKVDLAGWYVTPAHPLRGQALLEVGYDPALCPFAEAAFGQVVTLPIYPRPSLLQLDHIVRVLKEGSTAALATS